MNDKERRIAEELLAPADVRINGDRPWDIAIHDQRLYAHVMRDGTLGLGEAYMDGWWDAPALDQFFTKILSARLYEHVRLTFPAILMLLRARLFNLQTRSRAPQVAETHYDLGNDLYQAMLDKTMVYTCGYWSGTPPAKTLTEAQEAKMDLVCRKVGLTAGQKILDIGCGFGSFAKFAAERYGAHVVGVTLSKEQLAFGRDLCKGLSVELRLQDYREVHEPFDHIISIGMFEAVGLKNFRTYMKAVERCLNDGGLFLLHTIGQKHSVLEGDPWIEKYIFPNGFIPSAGQIIKASERLFQIEDWHNFGADYEKTLMAWFANFDAAWPSLKGKYDERFYRMWKYYLLSCAGVFRSRSMHLWQIVFAKDESAMPGGYKSMR